MAEGGQRAITAKARCELTRNFYAQLFSDPSSDASFPDGALPVVRGGPSG